MKGIELLGATLLHFLWQGVLIASVYAVARRCSSRPEVRYLVACAALAAMAASPVATWVALRPVSPQAVEVATSVPEQHATSAGSALQWDLARLLAPGNRPISSTWLSWVAAAWMTGVVILWLRLLGGWMMSDRLCRRHVRPAPVEWQKAFDALRARLRVSRPVRLLVSGLAEVPVVVGWLRPVVLVPVGALTGLPAGQIEALLLHELAHIRRHDYLVNVMQSMVEAVLFYHPAVWWVSGHMRSERELCCDDAAVAVTGDPLSYARALAEAGAAAHAHHRAAVASTGGSLTTRVARLLGEPNPASRIHSSAAVIAATALVAITVVAVGGQASRPQYEVASIKPAATVGTATIRLSPGRLTAKAPLRALVQGAFDLQPFQILGGPEWIGSDQYEIDARAVGNPDRTEILLMLQSLLNERFHLRFHRESREMPIIALVAARGGLDLDSVGTESCVGDVEVLGPLSIPGARMPPPGQETAPASSCGSLNVTLEAGGARLRGDKVPMVEFVRVLSRVLGRTVLDRTGFTRSFDVDLTFMPDEATGGLPPPPPGAAPFATVSPSIFDAVQKLGLRLESAKGPVEVLVIDNVGRPAPN